MRFEQYKTKTLHVNRYVEQSPGISKRISKLKFGEEI
jgi:hypothetical protein